MSQQAFEPGSIAPVTGLFELLHAFGFGQASPKNVWRAKRYPPAPRGGYGCSWSADQAERMVQTSVGPCNTRRE